MLRRKDRVVASAQLNGCYCAQLVTRDLNPKTENTKNNERTQNIETTTKPRCSEERNLADVAG